MTARELPLGPAAEHPRWAKLVEAISSYHRLCGHQRTQAELFCRYGTYRASHMDSAKVDDAIRFFGRRGEFYEGDYVI